MNFLLVIIFGKIHQVKVKEDYNSLVKNSRFLHTIEDMLAKDIADNKAIGDYGAKEILTRVSGDSLVRILTHCNTGSLATANYGTALGVIRTLHEMKRLGNFDTLLYLSL